jgi:hypothetical protein
VGHEWAVGYGVGTTTVDGGFQLHNQSGFAMIPRFDLNIFNVSAGPVEMGLDFFVQNPTVYGGEHNSGFLELGGALTFRGAIAPAPTVVQETCSVEDRGDYTREIRRFQEANHQLREENAEHAQLVRAIRQRLEDRSITREEMVTELRRGYEDYLEHRRENPVADAAERTRQAQARFPDDFDPFLWQEVEPREVPEDLSGLDCERLRNLERGLRDENAELREQRGLLLGLARAGFIRLGVPPAVAEQYTSAIARLRDVNFRTNTPFGQRAEESARANESGYTSDADIHGIESAATAYAGAHPIDPRTGLREAAPAADLERVFGPLFPPGEGRDGRPHCQSVEILADLATALRHPSMRNMQIFLVGHTSSPGTDDHNLALSRRRARAIRAFLVMSGIPENRLFTDGRGETELIYQRDALGGTHPEAAHQMTPEFATLRRYGITTLTQRREEAMRRQAVNRRMEITLCLPGSSDQACTALRNDPDIQTQMRAAGVLSSGASGSPQVSGAASDIDDSSRGGGEAETSVSTGDAGTGHARLRTPHAAAAQPTAAPAPRTPDAGAPGPDASAPPPSQGTATPPRDGGAPQLDFHRATGSTGE